MRSRTLKTIYDLTISTVTPLHIGSGDRLERGMDYEVFKGQTWVFNQEAIWQTYLFDENGRYLDHLQETPPARLLRKPADFQPAASFFHYVLNGFPLSQDNNAPIATFVKDMEYQPYIPGSSLKGALRTILLRHAYEKGGYNLQPDKLSGNPRKADDFMEGKLLSPGASRSYLSPNYDLLRAIHVADTTPVSRTRMRVNTATVFKRTSSKHMPIALECMLGDTTFKTTLTIDNYLYDYAEAAAKLGLPDRNWLTSLPAIANQQAKKRIDDERGFFKDWSGSGAQILYDRKLPENPVRELGDGLFLMQLGWGSGWEDKTLGYLISRGDRTALLKKYGRRAMARGRHEDGATFPKTRRHLTISLENGRPIPLGWVLVEMKQKVGR